MQSFSGIIKSPNPRCRSKRMRLPPECYQMYQVIEQRLTTLRPAQQMGLAVWVYGAIVAHSACQNAVATALRGLGRWHAVRQYLREWLYNGTDKAYACRTQVEVAPCFALLMRWLLSWWKTDQLALAMDSTMHKDRVNALVVSVLYRGCAIPVAWHILPANKPGAWVGPITELLTLIAPSVPKDMKLLVMSDRGLWSPVLWNRIRALGWHRLMRVKKNTVFQPLEGCRLPALRLVAGPGNGWIGAGTAFRAKGKRRFGTLVVTWDEGRKEPWIVLTDLPPCQVDVNWYGLRVWIELGFRALKGVGLKWQYTQRTDPERVSRHWLVMSVAMLWIMAYGSRLEDAEAVGIDPSAMRSPPDHIYIHTRKVSVFRQGIDWMRQHILKGRIWHRLWLMPEPWPYACSSLQITHHPICQFNPIL
jgi:hypothetical protein